MTEEFELELEYDMETFYVVGTATIYISEGIGTNYEGYDYERFNQREVNIQIDEIFYISETTNQPVQVLGLYKYKKLQTIAEEILTDKYN